jgi:hypothetical protein
MPLLSDAKKLFVGGTSINKVFSNGFVVWPKVNINPDRCIPDLSLTIPQAHDLSTECIYIDNPPYSDFRMLKSVYFWGPKCVDDPDKGYCSPVWRFIGSRDDPQPGYAPGEDWCYGLESLLYRYNSYGYAAQTGILTERYGIDEHATDSTTWWCYRIRSFSNPYMMPADERSNTSYLQYQLRIFLKDGPANNPASCSLLKSGVSCYDGNWIEGGGNPSKGFEKCVDNWNGFTYP